MSPKHASLVRRALGGRPGFAGTSQTRPLARRSIVTVASPSISAATTSPSSISGCSRTGTQSPSWMPAVLMASSAT